MQSLHYGLTNHDDIPQQMVEPIAAARGLLSAHL